MNVSIDSMRITVGYRDPARGQARHVASESLRLASELQVHQVNPRRKLTASAELSAKLVYFGDFSGHQNCQPKGRGPAGGGGVVKMPVPERNLTRNIGDIVWELKRDDDTERQLVHTRAAHDIVFILSICCLLIMIPGAGLYSPHSSRAGPAH